MIKLKLFRKKDSTDKSINREELISKFKQQIDVLHDYSTDTLEKIINYENKLRDLEKSNKKIDEQCAYALEKNNSHLYEKALIKLSKNTKEYDDICKTILVLKSRLKQCIEDISELENILNTL